MGERGDAKIGKERLAAFSDGVIAVIITIMVLELKAPHGCNFAALRPELPVFLSYVLSFVNVGIYWNNHHHMIAITEKVNGAVLWANMHLLFWLSLIPFTAAWLGENYLAAAPAVLYGVVLLAAGIAYYLLQEAIMRTPRQNPALAAAFGQNFKGKLSVIIYAIATLLAVACPWIGEALYVAVALMWLVPDPRIERIVSGREAEDEAETD